MLGPGRGCEGREVRPRLRPPAGRVRGHHRGDRAAAEQRRERDREHQGGSRTALVAPTDARVPPAVPGPFETHGSSQAVAAPRTVRASPSPATGNADATDTVTQPSSRARSTRAASPAT